MSEERVERLEGKREIYCEHCRYFELLSVQHVPQVPEAGECRRHAPNPCQHNGDPRHPPGFFLARWPNVYTTTEGCGDFKKE